jgi:hypothetical protein
MRLLDLELPQADHERVRVYADVVCVDKNLQTLFFELSHSTKIILHKSSFFATNYFC